MIKIVACDDDKYCLDKIEKLSVEYFGKNNIESSIVTYISPVNMLEADIGKLDIVFLDVEMGNYNGIDIGERIRSVNNDVVLIYISSFQSYAIEGYKVKARAFLLKESLEFSFDSCMDDIVEELEIAKKILTVKDKTEEIHIPYSNILFIESFGRKVAINTVSWHKEKYEVYSKISDIEENLSPFGFLKIHRSYIVNIKYVDKICKKEVYLTNGQIIRVAADNYMEIKRKITISKGR